MVLPLGFSCYFDGVGTFLGLSLESLKEPLQGCLLEECDE